MTAVITMGLLYIFLGGSHYGIISIAKTFPSHRALGRMDVGHREAGLGYSHPPWGILLTSGIPVQRIFAILAIFPAIFAVCGSMIGLLERAGKVRAAA